MLLFLSTRLFKISIVQRPCEIHIKRIPSDIQHQHSETTQEQNQSLNSSQSTLSPGTLSSMAANFLRNLPKVRRGELPNDSKCMICLEEYGTHLNSNGSIELAVRLPCTHHIGSSCIETWLSEHNTCPYCRTTFFQTTKPIYLGPHLDRQDLDPVFDLFRSQGHVFNEMNWRSSIMRVCTCVFEDLYSLHRARAALDRDISLNADLWHELASSANQFSQARAALEADEQTALEPEREIQGVAIAQALMETCTYHLALTFREMRFRDVILYVQLQALGARQLPSIDVSLMCLNREQEEALFAELERRGAFAWDTWRYAADNGSPRRMWDLLREDGFVFHLEEERWGRLSC